MGQSVEDGLCARRTPRWSALRITGMVAPTELRRNWRTLVLLGTLTAIWLAGMMIAAQGARRTSSALDRFTDRTIAADAALSISDDRDGAELLDAVRARSDVVDADTLWFASTGLAYESGPTTALAAAVDGRWGTAFDRLLVIDGRLPDPANPSEVAITAPLASALGVDAGEALVVPTWSRSQWYEWLARRGAYPQFDGPAIEVQVVGIVRTEMELGTDHESRRLVVATPAFVERWEDQLGDNERQVSVLFEGAADPAAAARDLSDQLDTTVSVVTAADAYAAPMDDAARASSLTLWVLAAMIGVSGLAVVCLGLTREVRHISDRLRPLTELGASRRQLVLVSVAPSIATVIVSLVAATIIAQRTSSHFPTGRARLLDPTAGDGWDWPVLLGGACAAGLALVVSAVPAARRGDRTFARRSLRRQRKLGPSGARSAIGYRRAGHRDDRVVTAAAAMLVAGTLGAIWFVLSLDRIGEDRTRWGYTWSASPDLGFAPERYEQAIDATLADADVASVGELRWGSALLDGRSAQLTALNTFGGEALAPRLLAGSLPASDFDLAVGPVTSRSLGVEIGDIVEIASADLGSAGFRVVGIVIPPSVFGGGVPGAGAYLTGGALQRVFANGGPGANPVIEYRAGVEPADVEQRLAASIGWAFPPRSRPTPPASVHNLLDVDATINWLTGFFALAAVGGAIIAGARHDARRARETGVLRALGLTDADVRVAAMAEASTIGAWALAIGLPIGLWGGAIAWDRAVRHLGIGDEQPFPVAALSASVALALCVAVVFGALVAHRAVRRQPAAELRAG